MKEWGAAWKQLIEKRREEKEAERSRKKRWREGMMLSIERRGSRSLSVFIV